MSKCFISYRHVKPDEDLAEFLEKFLKEHNHEVFRDTQMTVGTKWAKEIEKQLKSSDSFVVLLSAESIRSDMVTQEGGAKGDRRQNDPNEWQEKLGLILNKDGTIVPKYPVDKIRSTKPRR